MAFTNVFILAIVSMVSINVPAAWSFSAGAPDGACFDMVPQHHVAAQPLPAPYTIGTSETSVKNGGSVDVVIRGNTEADTIKGFLLQARIGDTPVGHFEVISPNVQLIDCGNSKQVCNLSVKCC